MNYLTSLQQLPPKAKICLYGSGDAGIRLRDLINKKRKDIAILFFIDTFKTGQIDGLPILQPEAISNLETKADLILIASMHFAEIEKKLQSLGYQNYLIVNPPLFNKKNKPSSLDRYLSRNNVSEIAIQHEYANLLDFCLRNHFSGNILHTLNRHQKGLWKDYLNNVYRNIPLDFANKTIVDFGCKYGDVFPMYRLLGAKTILGIEVEAEYIQIGRSLFCQRYEGTDIVASQAGYIPLQPGIADIVIMNEVISHINPMYIHVVIAEVARILKPGGVFFISDGNNLNKPGYFEKVLVPFYQQWENGPDGIQTDRDTVDKSFLTMRREIIQRLRPELSMADREYLAKNTSGLFGDFFIQQITTYSGPHQFIRRPYCRGICPTNPGDAGVVIEKGYYPQELKQVLLQYGFSCPRNSIRNRGENFQIYGIKKHG